MVVPGTYQVRLTVDGHSQTQAFEVLPDPRIAASPEDLTAQRDMLLQHPRQLVADERGDQRDSTPCLPRPRSGRSAPPTRRSAPRPSAVTSELGAIRAKLIDVNMKQAQLWPSGLHEKFNALLDSVDGADYAPPQQARDVYAELCAQLDELIGHLRDVDETRLAKLNETIQAAGPLVVGLER